MKVKINYYTGEGDIEIECETLEEAMKIADENASYTQKNIAITKDFPEELAVREWNEGTYGRDAQNNPIIFGTFGYYGDWIKL